MENMDGYQPPKIIFPGQRDIADAYRVAWDLLHADAPEQALEILAPALEAEPGNVGLRSLRAWAYFQRAQLDKARVELEFLVEADPTDVWARHTLGRLHERKSEYAAALPHLRLAAAMSGDPDHERAVVRVERMLEQLAARVN
ncbi:tetratricopeptide repeat protein [Nocardioides alcanivorans]|uniref:tetratricopeptide repeat protein n=1 Tax=Nocardioides alcanivorans TaxID=2897352 RepID=UPI001F21499F|nr:tetratricopeptide repeat protein [Nocardioides alcanivorans]